MSPLRTDTRSLSTPPPASDILEPTSPLTTTGSLAGKLWTAEEVESTRKTLTARSLRKAGESYTGSRPNATWPAGSKGPNEATSVRPGVSIRTWWTWAGGGAAVAAKLRSLRSTTKSIPWRAKYEAKPPGELPLSRACSTASSMSL